MMRRHTSAVIVLGRFARLRSACITVYIERTLKSVIISDRRGADWPSQLQRSGVAHRAAGQLRTRRATSSTNFIADSMSIRFSNGKGWMKTDPEMLLVVTGVSTEQSSAMFQIWTCSQPLQLNASTVCIRTISDEKISRIRVILLTFPPDVCSSQMTPRPTSLDYIDSRVPHRIPWMLSQVSPRNKCFRRSLFNCMPTAGEECCHDLVEGSSASLLVSDLPAACGFASHSRDPRAIYLSSRLHHAPRAFAPVCPSFDHVDLFSPHGVLSPGVCGFQDTNVGLLIVQQ